MDDKLPLSHVRERDIDLLLVEEISCSPSIRMWLASVFRSAIGCDIGEWDWKVRHSVSGSGPGSGETDLEILAIPPSGLMMSPILILIENKIDAPFSDRAPIGSQVTRYRARAKQGVVEGRCGHAIVALFAPEQYIKKCCGEFDVSVSYEEIVASLEDRAQSTPPELAARLRFRAGILEQAILRQKRGWVASSVSEVTSLWGAYYSIARDEFSQLNMAAPGAKPGDSYTVAFCGILPPIPDVAKCRIEHLMEGGYVFILIPGMAAKAEQVARQLGGKLPDGAYVKARGKALGINIDVPRISRMGNVPAQMAAIRTALRAAEVLRSWYHEHHQELIKALSS